MPLQTLRSDLSAHLQELQATLVDLINRDYNDLVSMSTSLVGIDDKIARLGLPIGHLKEQFEGSRDESAEYLIALRTLTGERDEVAERRAQLQVFMQIADSLGNVERLWQSPDRDSSISRGTADSAPSHESQDSHAAGSSSCVNLERVAGELRVVYTVCQRSPQDCAFIKQSRSQIDAYQARLLREAGISFGRAIDELDEIALKSALRVYAVIGEVKVAHRLFQHQYVRPALAEVAARVKKEDDGTRATTDLYAAAGEFLRQESTRLLLEAAIDLTETSVRPHRVDVATFDFVADSIWAEVYAVIQAVVFRPASEDFHLNYRLSTQFLGTLESTYTNRQSLQGFREHACTIGLLNKWDLHGKTYFQLHRNEVVLQAETALNIHETLAPSPEDGRDSVELHQTPADAISQLVVRMWDVNVFLASQTADFLRLTLDLVARFRAWLHASFCLNGSGDAQIPLKTRVLGFTEAQAFDEQYV